MEILKVRVWNKRSVPPCMMYWGKDFFNITFRNGHLCIGNSPRNKYFELHVLTDDFFRKDMPSCQGEVILMVSTGLKDKKKNEIWVGDILKFKNGISYVYYNEKIGAFGLIGYGGMWQTGKVVGNIFENPELLKKKAT